MKEQWWRGKVDRDGGQGEAGVGGETGVEGEAIELIIFLILFGFWFLRFIAHRFSIHIWLV